jgi:hypothetical protein
MTDTKSNPMMEPVPEHISEIQESLKDYTYEQYVEIMKQLHDGEEDS